jgi:hypothetical protein
MSSAREAIEKRLLEDGLAALDDPEVARAVAEDEALAALVQALSTVDDELAQLPAPSLPAGLVERTLARLRLESSVSEGHAAAAMARTPTPAAARDTTPAPRPARAPSAPPPLGLGDLIGTVVVTVVESLRRHPVRVAAVLLLGLLPALSLPLLVLDGSRSSGDMAPTVTVSEPARLASRRSAEPPPSDGPVAAGRPEGQGSVTLQPATEQYSREHFSSLIESSSELFRVADEHLRSQDARDDDTRRRPAGPAPSLPLTGEEVLAGRLSASPSRELDAERLGDRLEEARQQRSLQEGQAGAEDLGEIGRYLAELLPVEDHTRPDPVDLGDDQPPRPGRSRRITITTPPELLAPSGGEPEPHEQIELEVAYGGYAPEFRFYVHGPAVSQFEGHYYRGSEADGDEARLDRTLARDWLAARDTVEGVTFVEPSGYWANTYVPGDPLVRGLQLRLRQRDVGSAAATTGLALAHGISPVDQPFDGPSNAALGLHLQADRRSVEGESRVLLQVGLRATERRAGRRPAMNAMVVLDLRTPLGPSSASSVRALLEALAASRDVGDRFGLVVAGAEARVVIEPGELRYGTAQVAARDLLEAAGAAPTTAPTSAASLTEALVLGLERVLEHDDPTAPLGSSLLLLVTPGGLGEALADLEAVAHHGAVAGVPVSVIGLGGAAAVDELDRLALAGQGNRRLLVEPAMAADVVDHELAAAGRAVARAVRLRIRLAPGVRLVDVVGSERLGEPAAERVREAERSVDQRLARSLGIQADRGEDEAGIQIVIPTFYAGDDHVILLDLVVPQAGPVADVTVRYKDLVFLRNAVAADHLALSRGEIERGALERNVLANLLAHELSRVLAEAGALAADGATEAAAHRLRSTSELLRGLQGELAGFATDRGLQADLATLERYLSALAGFGLDTDELGESLLYASFLKRLRPPAVER